MQRGPEKFGAVTATGKSNITITIGSIHRPNRSGSLSVLLAN